MERSAITTFNAIMFIFKQPADIRAYLERERQQDKKCGFVPTMGALHQGHLSLVNRAKEENELVVCSIYVNPTQFNDPKDFERYPKTLEKDIYMLEKASCDVLFLPDTAQLYPPGETDEEKYDLGELEYMLEGKFRPGHFQGVCQVVQRLINIVMPEQLYLGQKDFQQCMVIKKLLTLMGMHTNLVICPIIRETNGLAMSSRNMRLSADERNKAAGIYAALSYIDQNIQPGPLRDILDKAVHILSAHGLRSEYIEIATVADMKPLTEWDGDTEIVALIAAYMGDVRLIDNMILPLNFANYGN